LVVGGGGREHALVRALARSGERPELLCAPANPGIAAEASCLGEVGAAEVAAILAAARRRGVDLLVVGPEAAMVTAPVEALKDAGVPAFAPSAAAAELAEITHAGTAERDGEIVTVGGRVAERDGPWIDPRQGGRSRIRCGRPDLLRGNADAV
jgi:phosphoribosylamine-glycine ligase